MKSLQPVAGKPLIAVMNTTDAYIHNCYPVKGTAVFVDVKNVMPTEIVIENNNLKNVKTKLTGDSGIVVK